MTAHISKPFVHVEDSNGNPYVAAKLYVYDYGTTNLKTIYSNEGLSVSVTNPLTSNASGDFDRVYIASGKYKLRAETAAAALIWEIDNIDTSLTSGSGALAISAGGTSATTAAAARTALGAAAQTDVDDLATDIATINAALTNITAIPQGYLTPTSGTPVISSGVTAGATVYYTPFMGNLCPIYSGSSMVVTEFDELTLSLVASHVASAIYDCFIINDAGTVRLVTGPAWNAATAGSGARGSGAGTTQISRAVGGIWTNTVAMTARYGATTVAVDANKGTYVGSIHMDGTNAQLSCLIAYGQNRKFGIWNAYNRQNRILKAGDPTASWTYNTASYRASNGSSDNKITVFSGLAEETYDCTLRQNTNIATAGQIVTPGIGYNSTTNSSGYAGSAGIATASVGASHRQIILANYIAAPALGINNIQALEYGGGAATCTFYGAEADMLLTVKWRG
jgi:hypothetical protein